MSCRIDCIKWFLFVFSLLWVLFGIAILAVGIFVSVTSGPSDSKITATSISTCFIVLGAIIFVIALFGYRGAIEEDHRAVVTYSVLLLVLSIIQVAFGIQAFTNEDPAGFGSRSLPGEHPLQETFNNYWISDSDRSSIDREQMAWSCCGISGPEDYYDKFGIKALPDSCCSKKLGFRSFDIRTGTVDIAFKNGCNNVVIAIHKNAAVISKGVFFGLAAFELAGTVLAGCLANSIEYNQRRGYGVLFQ